MEPETKQRPRWEIDRLLGRLVGEDVRVAARSFAPYRATIARPIRFMPVGDLFLPDNSQPRGVPVFFEGRLDQYERHVGVIHAHLEAPALSETAADGLVSFRGNLAVILRGPAMVELSFPFQVERLPADGENYWRDLRVPRVQFEFRLSLGTGGGDRNSRLAPSAGRDTVWDQLTNGRQMR